MASKDGVPGPVTHRYVSVKQHKLRGEYLRVFEVGLNGFVNVDPGSGQVTNRWRFDQLEEIILPDEGNNAGAAAAQNGAAQRHAGTLKKTNSQISGDREDGPAEETSPSSAGKFQLVFNNRDGGALSFGSSRTTMAFWSPCRSELLSTLYAKKLAGRQHVYKVQKISRKTPGKVRPCLLVAGESGIVEVADENATRILHAYRYVDIECVQRVEGDAIAFVAGIDKRPRAFATGQHTHALVASMSASAQASAIPVAFIDQTLTEEEWRAMARAYARSASAAQTVCEFPVIRRDGNGEKHVRLRVTTRHLVELDEAADEVLTVRSLTRVCALVRPIDFDGDFEVLLHSEDQDLEYTIQHDAQQPGGLAKENGGGDSLASDGRRAARDTLLAHLLDACARRKSRVSLLPTKPRGSLRLVPRNVPPPCEIEVLYFRRIISLVASQQVKEIGSPMHNMHLQRILQACADFTANSTWPMQTSSLAQLSSGSDLHGAGAVGFISLTGMLVRADPTKVHPRATLQALEVILRMVDRRDVGGLFNVSVTQTFELVSVLTVALEAGNDLVVLKGLEILSALVGRGVRDKARDRAAETANKVALLTPEMVDALAALWRRHAASALLSARVASLFEQTLVSGRDSTPEDLYQRLRETLLRLGNEVVRSLSFRTLETLESTALLLRVALEEIGSDGALEVIQEEALRSGALLQALHEAIFGKLDARGFASQCLVHNFTVGNKRGDALLRRILPAGLFSAGAVQLGRSGAADEAADPAAGAAPALRRTALEKRLDLAIHTLRSGHTPGNTLTKEIANGVAQMRRADALDGVFHVVSQTHETPNLIWNQTTRAELQQALEEELAFILAPGSAASFSWNYEEFAVNYPSLRDETMAGPAYLRLLLESDEAARQLREPKRVFAALYNQYLKDEFPEDSLRAMELVYRCHAPVIGEFADVTFLVNRLTRVPSPAIQELLLAVVRACAASKVNLVSLVLHPATITSLVATLPTSSADPVSEDTVRVAKASLVLLQELAALQSTTDAQGRTLRPPPRAVRLLSGPEVWPKLCGAMDTAPLAPAVADLLCTVISYGADADVLRRVHQTGLLEAALLIEDPEALVKVACMLDALLPYQRTQLLNFIPESLVCVLERDGPERFAEVYTGSNVHGADVIWTSEMREQVRAHLIGHRGGPTPPVVFEDLENEYFCNGYYLNRLAPMSPGELEIDKPVSLLEGILKLWRSDADKQKPNGVSQQEARQVLGLDTQDASGEADRATLDAAFRSKAAENDLDAATLASLQGAYRTLASRSPGRAVSSSLLLQTQALLYQQYKSELHGLDYPALDLLMSALQSEEVGLAQAAMRLAHALSAASPRHAVDLADRGAVELVVNTVDPASGLPLPEGLRCLVLWASLAKSKARVRESANLDKLLQQLLKVLELAAESSTSAATVQSALQVVARLADDESIQEDMFSRGFVWAALPLLFDAVQQPVSAKHAARALARLGGMLTSRELASPPHEGVVQALHAVLTAPVARLLREPNPSKLLATLNADALETPTVVWNADMRDQVRAFLASRPAPKALPELEVSERCVGGLYVRLFVECENKESALHELESPAATTMALLRAHEEEPRRENLVALAGIACAADRNSLGSIANALILAQPPVLPRVVENLSDDVLRGAAVDVLEAFCERQPSLCDAVGSALREGDRLPPCTVDATELDLRLLAALPFREDAEDVRDLLAVVVSDSSNERGLGEGPALTSEDDEEACGAGPEGVDSGSGERSSCLDARKELAIKVLQKCPDHLLDIFLPTGLIRALRHGALRETLWRDKVQEPELIWSSEALRQLREAVSVPRGSALISRVAYPEIDCELCVGGVFVRAFLDQVEASHVQLEDEPGFLRNLLDVFTQPDASRARAASGQPGAAAPPPRPQRRPSTRGVVKGAPPPIPSRSRKPSQPEEEGLKASRPPPPVPGARSTTPPATSIPPLPAPDAASEAASQRELVARAIVIMVKRCPDEAAALSTAGHGPRLADGLERGKSMARGPQRAKQLDEYLNVLLALAVFDSWAEHLAANTSLDVILVDLWAEDPDGGDPSEARQRSASDRQDGDDGSQEDQGLDEARDQDEADRKSVILDILDAMGPHLLREQPILKLLALIEPDQGALQDYADAVVDILHKTTHPGVRLVLEHNEIWQHYAVAEQV